MPESPFRFKRPSHKSSTPFFPGAWPSTSQVEVSRNTTAEITGMRNTEVRAEGNPSPSPSDVSAQTFPHLDQVMDFHRRMSLRVADSSTLPCPSSSSSPQLPLLSLTDTSNSLSDMVPTPDPQEFASASSAYDPFTKESLNVHRTGSSTGPPPRPPRNPSRVFRTTTHIPKDSAAATTADTLSPMSSVPSLSLPFHSFSFSPQSVTSFLPSPDITSSPDADSSSAWFARSALSSPAFSFSDQQQSSTRQVSTPFFSALDWPTSSRAHGISPSGSESSPRTYDVDSPILSSDDSPLLHRTSGNGHIPHIKRPVIGSSARDMDTFGLAASHNDHDDTRSTDSIPTSFQSTSGLEAQSILEASPTDNITRGGGRRCSSAASSLSMRSPIAVDLGRTSSRPNPRGALQHGSEDRSHMYPPNTFGLVTYNIGDVEILSPPSKVTKFWKLKNVKRIGGKILKLFGKTAANTKGREIETRSSGEGVGLAIITSAADVEYASVHPIPREESRRGSQSSPKRSTRIIGGTPSKRRSMPVTSTTRRVSQKQPARPTSFLALDSDEEKMASSLRLLSMPNIVGLPSRAGILHQEYRGPVGYKFNPEEIPKLESDLISEKPTAGDVSQLSPPFSPISSTGSHDTRSRSQTAPPSRIDIHATKGKGRRFSLSSALSKANMDALRTTVIPHPPLPKNALATLRQRSASASTGSNWASRPTLQEAGKEHKPRPYSVLAQKDVIPRQGQVPNHGAGDHQVEMGDKNGRRGSNATTTVRGSPGSPIGRNRQRSHTQASSQSRSQLERTPTQARDGEPKRRSRGFSLSSAISKRALKARSIITGRGAGVPAMPTKTNGPELATLTSVGGVSFKMVTEGRNNADHVRSRGEERTMSGCAEFEPDLVLDRMSFAETPDLRSRVGSTGSGSLNLSLSATRSIESSSFYGAVTSPMEGYSMGRLSDELQFEAGRTMSSMSMVTEDGGMSDVEERVEEREFMRTLGLEFDEILKRAGDENE